MTLIRAFKRSLRRKDAGLGIDEIATADANSADEGDRHLCSAEVEAGRFGVDDGEWPVLGCCIGLFPHGLEPGICKKAHRLFNLRFLIMPMNRAREFPPNWRP
jgi:hypothetical protein